MLKKIFIFSIVLIVVAGLVFLGHRVFRGKAASFDDIPTYQVTWGEFVKKISSIGAVQAASSIDITAEFSGKIVKLVPEGTFVNKDDPIIWMETTEFEEQLKDREAEVKLGEAELKKQQQKLELLGVEQALALKSQQANVQYQEMKYEDAKIKYENQKIMVEKNLAARSTLDEAKLGLLQAELSLKNAKISLQKLEQDQLSQLRTQQAEIERAQVNLEREQRRYQESKEKLEKATIRAPAAGYLTYHTIWKGGTMGKVAEGDQVWQRHSLAEIPDSEHMQVIVPINEIDISAVKEGQEAIVSVDALPDKTFEGKVEKKGIVPLTDLSMRAIFGGQRLPTKEFEVKVTILGETEILSPGMTASVGIIINRIKEVLYVPLEAVFEEGDKHYVFKKEGYRYRQVFVTNIDSNENFAAIEGDIKVGEEVFLRNPEEKIEKIGITEELSIRRAAPSL